MGASLTLAAAEGAVILGGALLAWVIGLYVATRGGWRPIPALSLVAVAVLVVYLCGAALAALAPERSQWAGWLRQTWWAAALAPAAWLALVVAIAREEVRERAEGRLLGLAVAAGFGAAAGLAFGLVGGMTDLLVGWEGTPDAPRHLPPAPLFLAYQAYVVASLGIATAVLGALWRSAAPGTSLRDRLAGLLGSSLLFLLAGGYLTMASGLFGVSGLPGMLLLLAGLLLMAWDLARYGALLAGEVAAADLAVFAVGLGVLSLLYGSLLLLPSPTYAGLERALPLLLVLLATHALGDARAHLLDRLLLGPVRGAARGRLRDLAARVGRQADAVAALTEVREGVDALVREQGQEAAREAARGEGTPVPRDSAPPEFRLLVEGALRHLNDLPGLSVHPLLDEMPALLSADAAMPLERGTRLRGAIEAAIERLRPAGGTRPTPGSPLGPGGWLHYLVLREAYVDGRPNKQIMQRYHLSEGTFHRARRRAVDAVALDLSEAWRRPSAAGPPARASV